MSRGADGALRERTREHYDRHPFGFADDAILDEQLERRVLGRALRAAPPGALVLDVGCGASRVARLVRRLGGARAVGVDLSLGSLREGRAAGVGPLVQGDNLALPFRNGCADLVVSNGVIHHTPDPRAAFRELARVVRPGGTLVVSVYARGGWYELAWHTLGAAVRALRRVVGDTGLRVTLFPLFHAALLVFLPLATRRRLFVDAETAWRLFHDQLTTPRASFHGFDELERWGAEAGLACAERAREAARQLATLRLVRPGAA